MKTEINTIDGMIASMKEHIEADKLVQGSTGEDGKGCTIFCCIGNYKHRGVADIIGCGRWLPYLCDVLFEGQSVEESREFSLNWLLAVKKAKERGADIDSLCFTYLKWILKGDLKYNSYQFCNDEGKKVTDTVYELLTRSERGDMPTRDECDTAIRAVWELWRVSSRYTRYAVDATYEAARCVTYGVDATADVVAAAVAAAMAVEATEAMKAEVRKAAFKSFADKLIKLLEG